MAAIDNMTTFWPEWNIEEKVGSGAYGEVYRVSRQVGSRVYYSAVKVISIPQSQAQIDAVRAENRDEQSTRQYFQEVVNGCIDEISLMMDLRGASNIVTVEDYKVCAYPNELRWDIFIRMEYLTCLTEIMSRKTFTEKEAAALGIDLCNALCYCEKHHIIHRDIKPGNIFISADGDYKLGDFGIARRLSQVQSVMSSKGTYDYMAPEMFHGEYYDASVDTYALGIVLYKLLNNNRGPFLDPYAPHVSAMDKERALTMRLSGKENLPAPVNASVEMSILILQACRFDPSQRFPSPQVMKSQLESILSGQFMRAGGDVYTLNLDMTETVNAAGHINDRYRNGPQDQDQNSRNPYRNNQQNQNWNNQQNQNRNNHETNGGKRSGLPVIPFVLAGCMALIVAGYLMGRMMDKVRPFRETDIDPSVTESVISVDKENAEGEEKSSSKVEKSKAPEKETSEDNEKETANTPTPTPTLTPTPSMTPTPTPTPSMTPTPTPTPTPVPEETPQVLDRNAAAAGGKISSVDNVVYIADVYEYLTLRDAPSTGAKAICLLPPYSAMYITEYTNNTMVKVVTVDNGYAGYVNRNYITPQGSATVRAGKSRTPAVSSDTVYYADVYDYLTLRSAASTSAGELDRLPPYTAMYVHSWTNGMAYVTVADSGATGYVNADYISSNPNAMVRAGKSSSGSAPVHGFSVGDYCYADVNEYLTLRNAPSTSAGELNRLPDGTRLLILELTNSTMMKVRVESTGEVGYVNRNYVD